LIDHLHDIQALANWEVCMNAWETALSCLPPEHEMTPEHKALKTQFDAGLKKAKDSNVELHHAAQDNVKVMSLDQVQNDLPWKRALAMEKELIAKEHTMSSVRIYFISPDI
jgi:hypothetical protein